MNNNYNLEVPFSAFRRVFCSGSSTAAARDFAMFEQCYGTLVPGRHVPPAVIALLVNARSNRDLAAGMLAACSSLRALHLVVTPTHSITMVVCGPASTAAAAPQCAWAVTDMASGAVVFAETVADARDPAVREGVPGRKDGARSLAHELAVAMSAIDLLPKKTALMHFASTRDALACSSLVGHLDLRFVRWARANLAGCGSDEAASAAAAAAAAPPVPPASPASVHHYARGTASSRPTHSVVAPVPAAQIEVQSRIQAKQQQSTAASYSKKAPTPLPQSRRRAAQSALRNSLQRSGVLPPPSKKQQLPTAADLAATKRRKLKTSREIHRDRQELARLCSQAEAAERKRTRTRQAMMDDMAALSRTNESLDTIELCIIQNNEKKKWGREDDDVVRYEM
jgi:hypothetical protein